MGMESLDATRREPSMRQLAAFPNADTARTLSDYLLTLRIDTHLEQLPDGWAVWVRDEDRLAQARQELAAFTANPADPRFAAARRAAEAAHRRQDREEKEYAAPRPAPSGPAPRPGPWTFGLMATCLLVFFYHTGYLVYLNGGFGSPRAGEIILWGHAKDMDVRTSPAQQALSVASFEAYPDGVRWDGLLDVERGQVWRLVTPIFIHFGLIHLVFNLTMLWQLGAAVEVRRGAWRFLLLVLVTAVISNGSQYFLDVGSKDGSLIVQHNPMFGGMSGVLYGLFGYVWMKSRYDPDLGLGLDPRTVFWMIGWLFLCMSGLVGSVANTAHVAGLAVGMVIGVAPHLWRLARGRRPT